jgi:pantothenate kinase type III
MRTLVVDAGNSGVKLAAVVDGAPGPADRLATAARPPVEALRVRLLALDPGRQAAVVVLVSVVPAWTDLVRAVAASAGLPLLVADARTIPIAVRLPDPSRVGADRLLAAWGAARDGAPAIVIDLGTATTVDAVDAGGAFLGGAIMPGIGLALGSLARGTALLPDISLSPPERAIGRDTAEAIRSGVVLGHLGALRELVARMRRELGRDGDRARIVATGGLTATAWVGKALVEAGPGSGRAIADRVDAELVLRALDALARHHAEVPA